MQGRGFRYDRRSPPTDGFIWLHDAVSTLVSGGLPAVEATRSNPQRL
ncbi:hypothetical protein HMPREF9622_02055 [Cutibacterium modestum HL037PA3]|nr:hypothetical protein HMPREF9622_02055 [Cutibacterium modestum HL037PA3]